MKRSFFVFLFVFCFLVFPVAAQEYTITEAELLRLEKISENLEMNRRNQQLQIQSLKEGLTEALNLSENLTSLLKEEQETLKSLRQSYNEYEGEVNIALEAKTRQIEKLKKTGDRLKLSLVILSCLLALLVFGSIGFFILKIKLKLGRF